MFKFLSCFDAHMCYCTQISDNLESLDQLVGRRQIMHKCTELYMILLCFASYVDASGKFLGKTRCYRSEMLRPRAELWCVSARTV